MLASGANLYAVPDRQHADPQTAVLDVILAVWRAVMRDDQRRRCRRCDRAMILARFGARVAWACHNPWHPHHPIDVDRLVAFFTAASKGESRNRAKVPALNTARS